MCPSGTRRNIRQYFPGFLFQSKRRKGEGGGKGNRIRELKLGFTTKERILLTCHLTSLAFPLTNICIVSKNSRDMYKKETTKFLYIKNRYRAPISPRTTPRTVR